MWFFRFVVFSLIHYLAMYFFQGHGVLFYLVLFFTRRSVVCLVLWRLFAGAETVERVAAIKALASKMH
ncbi:MAG TPA: hypothetical protein DEP05_00930 [Betaproteobacteria bacterium]|nr:hypothetical protein [Betaproteobacteria bacterium]